jgi:hypothetical protein
MRSAPSRSIGIPARAWAAGLGRGQRSGWR